MARSVDATTTRSGAGPESAVGVGAAVRVTVGVGVTGAGVEEHAMTNAKTDAVPTRAAIRMSPRLFPNG